MSNNLNKKNKIITSIGGQALIEGILMRGPGKDAVALRSQKDGSITKEFIHINSIKNKSNIFKLPFIRGIVGFIDSMLVGHKALMLSADKYSEGAEDDQEEMSKFEKWLDSKLGDKLTSVVTTIFTIVGVLLSILLFFVVPIWVFNLMADHMPFLNSSIIYRSVFEGVFRIALFLIYIVICSQMKEMKRVFQYHGAEHKTIFCYEAQEELTVENVKKFERFHPRCGTSFIVLMLLVGILIGLFIPATNPIIRSLIKILLLPLMVGIGYELIKLCSRTENIITKIIAAPGLWMQRITTKEPEDDMIEIAIAAMKEVIPENGEDQIKKN